MSEQSKEQQRKSNEMVSEWDALIVDYVEWSSISQIWHSGGPLMNTAPTENSVIVPSDFKSIVNKN